MDCTDESTAIVSMMKDDSVDASTIDFSSEGSTMN